MKEKKKGILFFRVRVGTRQVMSICLKVAYVAGRKLEAQELPGPSRPRAWYGIFVIARLAC